jgi:membrane protein DedA with SNARE-associated domain
MPLPLYLPATVVGSVAWAIIYATIGLAVVEAWVLAAVGSWYALAGIIALIVVGITTWVLGRKRSKRQPDKAEV